jgi:quinol monooxygenase YgiN
MIARSWGGKVPIKHAEGFQRHLIATGVADYRQQPGCLDVQLWRRDGHGWAYFLLLSVWVSMDAIRGYAGERPDVAVLYPKDDAFGLVPDLTVTHYGVLDLK